MDVVDARAAADAQATLVAALGALRDADDVGALLARAADLAVEHLPFDRAVVLSAGRHAITADDTEPPTHGPSDRLRRGVLAHPVELRARTREAHLVRTGQDDPELASALAEALELDAVALGAITAPGGVVAILVAERAGAPVGAAEHALVATFAAVTSFALEHALLRQHNASIARELRYLITSAKALMEELSAGPSALPSAGRQGYPGLLGELPAPASELHTLLTPREIEIAGCLATGQTNREIADTLVVSPETVKAHVARILRKLGAHTRAEAVARYLALNAGERR